MKKTYIHTINGHPAFFNGNQICFLPSARAKDVLRYSLAQIKAERRKSAVWRETQGLRADGAICGHVMFYT